MNEVQHCANQHLRRQFGHVLRELGQELLPEDGLIASVFLSTDTHMTLEELHELVRQKHPEIDLSHVNRTMRLLCDLAIAQKLRIKDRAVYEHLHLDNHHDHFVCVRCGCITEFVDPTIEARQEELARLNGFTPLMHKMEIRGICAKCAGNIPATRALATCLVGELVEIVEVLGGRQMKERLGSMGLLRGTKARVLSADGPITLDVRGSRLAIGRQQAAKIIIRHPGENDEQSQDIT